MAPKTVQMLVSCLAFLATLAQGNILDALEKRESGLEKRDCDPGATLCGTVGLLQYCARAGYKCCDTMHIAPLAATCCPGGSYAPVGNYCCTNGRNCPNGRSCTGCTPTDGNGGFVGSSRAPVPSASTPPTVTSTRVATVFTYYYFTITYYYYRVYWIYVPSITRSTVTSSTVSTSITVSVYAANSADASSSFSALSATISLPTPASATILPSLPSESPVVSSAVSSPTTTSSARGNVSSSASPSPSQFGGGAMRLADGGSIGSMMMWVALVTIGVASLVMSVVL